MTQFSSFLINLINFILLICAGGLSWRLKTYKKNQNLPSNFKFQSTFEGVPDDLITALIESKSREMWEINLENSSANITHSMKPFSDVQCVTLEDHFAEMSVEYRVKD